MTNEEVITLVKKNPIPVACGIICLAVAVAIYFRSDEIPAAEAELAQKSAEGERYAANIKNAVQLKEQVDTLTAAVREIDARAIHANQLGTNSQFFYKLENETGVKFLDFRQASLTAAKGKGSYVPITFNVSLQGDISQILKVLRVLESGARYSRILTATCSINGQTRNVPVTLTLTLDLLGVP